MSSSRRSRTAWLVGIGLLLLVVVVAVVMIPRLLAPDRVAAPAPAAPSQAASRTAEDSPSAGPLGPLRIVGFGDSVMAGTACDCDDFMAQAANLLERRTGREVVAVNNGANGETTDGVLRELRTDDALAAEISRADVVVLTIGANDLGPVLDDWQDGGCDADCYRPEIADMGSRLSTILTVIDRHKRAGTPVLVTSYWNVFEDGQVGVDGYGPDYPAWSDRVTREANSTICATAQQAGAVCVDLYRPFKGDGSNDPTALLADDGDHPNEEGTRLIAHAVTDAVEHALAR